MNVKMILPMLAVAVTSSFANAQAVVNINTGGDTGAYHTVFGKALANFLKVREFDTQLATSQGSPMNIERTLTSPTDLSLTQMDVYALMRKDGKVSKDTQLLRSDLGRECLFAVVSQEKAKSYPNWLAVIELAARTSVGVKTKSGSAYTLDFLQSQNPALDNLTVREFASDDDMLNDVASGKTKIGFFVAQPNLTTKFFQNVLETRKLGLVAVADETIQNARIDGNIVYSLNNIPFGQNTVTTSCLPIAIITGSSAKVNELYPDSAGTETDERSIKRIKRDNNMARINHQDMVRYVKTSKVEDLMKGFTDAKQIEALQHQQKVSLVKDPGAWLREAKDKAIRAAKEFRGE